jgi:hypothetical protein
MAVTAKVYGNFPKHLFKGDVDTDTATFKVMLCTSTYTPNQDTHEFKSSVTNEITGTGYTAGGVALASVAVAYDAASNTLSFDAADSVWTTATFTARYAVVYLSTGVDATSILVCYIDFGADLSPNAGNFTLQWNTGGIVTAVVA